MSDDIKKPAHKGRANPAIKEIPEKPEAIKKLEQAFKAIAKTDNGQLVLRHIMNLCGYKDNAMIYNPVTNEIHMNATLWNEAKRGLWIELRQAIPINDRNEIEKDIENE